MLDSIPFHRQLIYALALGLLPIVLVAVWFISEKGKIQEVEELFQIVESQALLKERKQAQNTLVINFYKDADHFYIDKHLETQTFLEAELEHLQNLMNGNLPVSDLLRKRYEKLNGPENQMHFIEGQVLSYANFQETTENLAHPIEVSVEDVQKILSKIEGIPIGKYLVPDGRPQLIITDFKMDKKNNFNKNESFVLTIKLLKREYL